MSQKGRKRIQRGACQAKSCLRAIRPGGAAQVRALTRKHCIYLTRKANAGRAKNSALPTPSISMTNRKRSASTWGPSFWRTGTEVYDPSVFDTYGYNKHPNIVTSLEFERMLSPSGPTEGHLVTLSDHKEIKKNRLAAVCGLAGHASRRQRVLLLGVLHLCHKRSRGGQGARKRRARRGNLLYRHQDPRQGFRTILQPGAGRGRSPVRQVEDNLHYSPGRHGRHCCFATWTSRANAWRRNSISSSSPWGLCLSDNGVDAGAKRWASNSTSPGTRNSPASTRSRPRSRAYTSAVRTRRPKTSLSPWSTPAHAPVRPEALWRSPARP